MSRPQEEMLCPSCRKKISKVRWWESAFLYCRCLPRWAFAYKLPVCYQERGFAANDADC